MSCPRCKLARGVDPAGACRCCGFYMVERERVRVTEGVSKTPGEGSIPSAPANPALECPDLPLSPTAERRLWCWWWLDPNENG